MAGNAAYTSGGTWTSAAITTVKVSAANIAWRGITVAPDDGIGAITGLGGTTSYNAGDAATIVNGSAAFSDLSNFKGGSLTITPSGGTNNDTISVKAGGLITLAGTSVSYNGNVIGVIDATLDGTSGKSLKIAFNTVTGGGSDVLAAGIQALMNQVTFATTSGAAGGNRVLSFQVTQNDGQASTINAAAQQTIVVTAGSSNQAPIFDLTGPFSVPENSAGGTAVGTVTAHDPDVGQTIAFSAIGSGTGAGLFDISSTGAITVHAGAALDFEGTKTYTFGVRVTDNGSSPQSTDTTVTINLSDVNESPTFAAGAITRSLVVGSANGTAVVGGPVTATDPDAGDSVASYQITGGNGTGSGAFAIDSTGHITVIDASQVTGTGVFTLQITATDTHGLTSAAKSVTINVVTDADPVFNPKTYSFSLPENSANNTNVGTPLTATDADTSTGDSITYSITAGNGTGAGAFKIDATGQISVNAVAQLDFETTPVFTLTVHATDMFGHFDTATVTINLTNVPEAPVIPANQSFTIAENTPASTVVGTVSATFDSSAVKSFSITGGNGAGSGAFAIDSNGQITIADASQIDYEAVVNHSFLLTVKALDTANSLSITNTVTVNLTNVQEGTVLSPGDIVVTRFDSSNPDEFGFVPLVNLAAGTEIRFTDNGWFAAGGFRANEGDIVYVTPAGGLTAGTEIGITVNSTTGVASIVQTGNLGTAFNETTAGSFGLNSSGDQLIVFQGTVASPTPLFALTTNSNVFDADATSASSSALPAGLVVGTTAIALGTSVATTANAQYNNSLLVGSPSQLRSAIANSANWATSAARLTFNYTNLTINFPPVAQASSVTTLEETPKTFAASDFLFTDTENDNLVSITVSNLNLASGDTLTVDQGSGAVTVTNGMTITVAQIPSLTYTPALNANGSALSKFDFKANDAGLGTVSATMTINVTPVNDAPTLDNITDPAPIDEESGEQTVTITGISTGPANESGQTITSVTATSGNTALIASVSVTGTGATRALKYTPVPFAHGTAVITVTVTDDGGTANGGVNTITKTFTVTVNAINHTPVFNDANIGYLASDNNGAVVGTVTATDRDGDTLTYTIDPADTGNTGGAFAVSSTGQITVANKAALGGTFQILLRATDNGTGNLFDTATITLRPDTIPTIVGAGVPAQSKLEDDAPFTIDLSAFFADDDTLTYAVQSNTPGGLVSTGVSGSTLTITPQANANGTATITVRATDTVNQFVEETFNVILAPVNDAPTLNDIPDPAPILEDSSEVTIPIGGISAGPANESSQNLTVTATSGNTALISSVSVSGTGSFRDLKYTPVPNANGTAVITVTVTDDGGTAGGGVNTITKTFTVTVTPVNDAPTDLSLDNATVNENLAPGATVGTVSTIDPDAVDSFTYSLTGTGNDNAKFLINPATGALTTNATFDFETKSSYTVHVTSTDSGGLTVSKDFTITVNDTNDAPTNLSLDHASVNENLATGAAVGTVTTTDPDAVDSFTYSLTGTGNDNAKFLINPTT
ncbi:beta strand repeat-containing protein, partial [Zavarzinella formosa]|uniref:beta strand repeat-containing protein n=1 Tax=Zavarzinella formosa TaxID=360055 RepID=UPI001EE640E6